MEFVKIRLTALEETIINALEAQRHLAINNGDTAENSRYLRLIGEYKMAIIESRQPVQEVRLCECSEEMSAKELMAASQELVKMAINKDPHAALHELLKVISSVDQVAGGAFSALSGSEGGSKPN